LLLRREHRLTHLTDFRPSGAAASRADDVLGLAVAVVTTRQFSSVVIAWVGDLGQRYWLLSLGVLAIDGISIPFIRRPRVEADNAARISASVST
jgi:hypothetical protein